MVTRAILAKVYRCKPNRRSGGYRDCKQGSKLLKVNYFASGCSDVGFSTSREEVGRLQDHGYVGERQKEEVGIKKSTGRCALSIICHQGDRR
jgi:hypothetical protein